MMNRMDKFLIFKNKGLIMLFSSIIESKGREHKRNEMDESYMVTNVLCSSYLRIFNSHTHTYLDGDTNLL